MNKFLLLCGILILTACGNYNPCSLEYDFYAKGLCVKSNGFPVKPELLEQSLNITEEEFNNYFPTNIVDLESLLFDNGVVLVYVEYLGNIGGVFLPERNDPETGKLNPPTIYNLGWFCSNKYYIVAHEVLHAVVQYHLQYSYEENASHLIQKVFFNWAYANDLPEDTVVENPIFERITGDICGLE